MLFMNIIWKENTVFCSANDALYTSSHLSNHNSTYCFLPFFIWLYFFFFLLFFFKACDHNRKLCVKCLKSKMYLFTFNLFLNCFIGFTVYKFLNSHSGPHLRNECTTKLDAWSFPRKVQHLSIWTWAEAMIKSHVKSNLVSVSFWVNTDMNIIVNQADPENC